MTLENYKRLKAQHDREREEFEKISRIVSRGENVERMIDALARGKNGAHIVIEIRDLETGFVSRFDECTQKDVTWQPNSRISRELLVILLKHRNQLGDELDAIPEK